jgi:hypothetical protein
LNSKGPLRIKHDQASEQVIMTRSLDQVTEPPLRRQPPHDQQSHDHVPSWQRVIWLGCAIGLMVMIVGLIALVAYMLTKIMDLLQFKGPVIVSVPDTSGLNPNTPPKVMLYSPDYAFVFTGISLVNSSLLRLLAILIGGAIAFVGLAVSFFVHQKTTSMDANATGGPEQNAKFALATNSPGLVAVVIGAIVIIVAVVTKATHTYVPGQRSGEGVVLPHQLPPRDTHVDEESTELKALDDAKKSNSSVAVPEK